MSDPTNAEILQAVRDLDAKVEDLAAKFGKAADQIGQVADMAGPAIEQLSGSPIMRMLTGGKKRGD